MTVTIRSRRPAQTNLVITALLVILVALLASHVQREPPPQIAEFNPSQQQIKEPPADQAPVGGNGGQGVGGGGGGAGNGAASPPVPPILASPLTALNPVRHCIRARQTEDPQSPPCVNYFSGDNGGATSPGVTRDSITVAIPTYGQGGLTNDDLDMEKYFNSRYEFYGRKLKFVSWPISAPLRTRNSLFGPTESMPDPSSENADAARVAQLSPFADLGYASMSGDRTVFLKAMARDKIIVSESDATVMTEADYTALQPYIWNYFPAADTSQRNFAAYICARLKPFAAQWADPTIVGKPRKFGLIIGVFPNGDRPDTSVLVNGLQACGIVPNGKGPTGMPIANIVYDSTDTSFKNVAAQFANPADEVTSVLCICMGGIGNDNILHRFQYNADGQNYYPEYVVNHFIEFDNDTFLIFEPPCDQKLGIACTYQNRDHTFGMSPMTKWDQYYAATMPCGYTVHEVDPSAGSPPGYCFDNESSSGGAGYQDLLLLASGIQMAGPHLTPETFQAGLFKAQFENPSCDGPPLYQSCVGFGPGDHTMEDSYVEIWASDHDHLDDTQIGSTFTGTWCYGDLTTPHGIRYRLQRPGELPARPWPTTQPVYEFGEPCH